MEKFWGLIEENVLTGILQNRETTLPTPEMPHGITRVPSRDHLRGTLQSDPFWPMKFDGRAEQLNCLILLELAATSFLQCERQDGEITRHVFSCGAVQSALRIPREFRSEYLFLSFVIEWVFFQI